MIVLALLVGIFTFSAMPALASTRPNVLMILADDQRADTIRAWGNPHIRTPNLDSLVRRGFSFRRNYCFGSNSGAVCVPSRAMLHTGKTWLKVDLQMKGTKLLSEQLREHGYETFATGKWHNGEESFLRAFPQARNVFFGGMSDHTKAPVRDSVDGKLGPVRIADSFSSVLFADTAVEFLKQYRGGRPFFAYVAFTAPHDPRQPPAGHAEEYYRRRPPLPINFLPQHAFDNGFVTGRDEELAAWPRERSTISDQLAEYYGMITHLDSQVGRILKELKDSGHDRNTIVIYAADNGLALGSHGLLGKQSVYEHSMRVPLIFAGAGIPKGSTNAFSYLLDVYPTLCDVLGIPSPTGMDGRSLRPIWEKRAAKVRDSVFLPYQTIMRAVNDGRWKLIRYPQIDHTQLFDLERDPHEMRNLAGDSAHGARVSEMIKLLVRQQGEYGDALPLTAENPRPKAVDLTGRPRKPDEWQPEWIRRKYFGEESRP